MTTSPPFVVNQHRNGLLTPWGYNPTHKVPQLTIEDYVNSRYILNPLRLWDCDRPVNASAAYLFTTAERARAINSSILWVALQMFVAIDGASASDRCRLSRTRHLARRSGPSKRPIPRR